MHFEALYPASYPALLIPPYLSSYTSFLYYAFSPISFLFRGYQTVKPWEIKFLLIRPQCSWNGAN